MTAKSHWREGAIVWRLGWARLRPRLWIVLAIVAAGAVGVLLQNGWDDRVLNAIRVPENPAQHSLYIISVGDRVLFSFEKPSIASIAGRVSYWGDQMWSVPLAVLIWVAGAVCNRKRWRRLGWACLWAFLVASVAVNVFRTPLGRARPNSELADGFYGPHLASKYQGFPSGHSTTSFATAAALVSATPLLSVPCAVYAATVGWSRMQLNRHHPLDVLTGAALGGFVGLCFGGALPGSRWRLRRKQRRL
ncbi:MAG: phosphatase PAP2 family protein [Verrucomicrobia bacterium]|nr:phosphatase PAP2 family protein [Verrucomicrobiota bacterium]